MITECGIILLSLLVNDKKVDQRSVSNSIISKLSGKNILINTLQDKFSDEEIRSFLAKCKSCLGENGRLPYTRELGSKHREMRKLTTELHINNLDFELFLNEFLIKDN